MKYLLNLQLALAALLEVWFASLASCRHRGPAGVMGRRGAMVLVRLEPVALAWILLLPVIAGSVFADAFDWLPVRRRWLQLTLVLGASVLIGTLVIPCVLVAIGGSAAVGQIENKHFGLVLIGGATIAVTVVPLIVTAWLAWLIDAPPISRHAALPRRPHRPRLDGAHRRLSRHGHAARGNRGDPGDGGALPADGRRARGHDACRLADKIRTVCRPGEDSDYDTYVDRWFAERLAARARGFEENGGKRRLSEALRDLQSAIAEAYPKLDAAETYPREVAVARAHIDAALAVRRQRN